MNVPLVQGTGLTRRKLKKPNTRGTKYSTTKGANRGKAPKIVAYCPVEVGFHQADPEKDTSVSGNNRTGVCKNGHVFPIGGKSVHTRIENEQSA